MHVGSESFSGGERRSLFVSLAPDFTHRCQLLHHSAALKLKRILRAASSANQIMRAADILFDEELARGYASLLARVRREYLSWAMEEPEKHPKFSVCELGFTQTNEDWKPSCKISLDLARQVAPNSKPLPSTHRARPMIVCM